MGEAEQILSVSQAAWLANMTAQTIRNWITSGKLPAEMTRVPGKPASYEIRLDDLVAIPGLIIDPDRLQTVTAHPMAERLDKRLIELEQRQAATDAANERNEKRIEVLERQIATLLAIAAPPSEPLPAALPPARMARVRAALTPADADAVLDDYLPERYANWQRRAVFLENHGWAPSVTRSWRDDCPLGPPEAVLRYALEHDAKLGYRATMHGRKVHPCGVPECPCHRLFASLSRAADEQPY